jgi:integrase/recombinase XerD
MLTLLPASYRPSSLSTSDTILFVMVGFGMGDLVVIRNTAGQSVGVPAMPRGRCSASRSGKPKSSGQGAISRTDVWYMVRRRAADAGIETAIGCHTFRATGITDYLTNGGRIEVAQRMAGHSNAKTTGLYDRRNDDISVGEVDRIGI